MKSYFWVYWELLLAGRGKRDRQNFREKFSPKIIHLKTIFSIFFGPTFFSTSGCEELFLGLLGAAAGRKREEGSSKFSRKIFSKNNTSENYFFDFFRTNFFSTSGCEELFLGLLGAAAGRKREEGSSKFSRKIFSKNNTSENYFFDFFRTNFFLDLRL